MSPVTSSFKEIKPVKRSKRQRELPQIDITLLDSDKENTEQDSEDEELPAFNLWFAYSQNLNLKHVIRICTGLFFSLFTLQNSFSSSLLNINGCVLLIWRHIYMYEIQTVQQNGIFTCIINLWNSALMLISSFKI